MLKSLVRSTVRKFGYDIVPAAPDDTAERYSSFRAESLRERRFYSVGAGDFNHPYWTNIDLANDWYEGEQSKKPFINYDLMALKPLPLPDNSAEAFFCCHVVEHISDEAVTNLCREVYRTLKPGGFFRILTPDADLEFKAYQRGDRDFFYWASAFKNVSLHRIFLNHFASEMAEVAGRRDGGRQPVPDTEIQKAFATMPMGEALSHFTRQCTFNPKFAGSHINWWTGDKLGAILRHAGFSTVYRSGHGQSLSPPMRDLRHFDAPHYIRFSLYMEAIK